MLNKLVSVSVSLSLSVRSLQPNTWTIQEQFLSPIVSPISHLLSLNTPTRGTQPKNSNNLWRSRTEMRVHCRVQTAVKVGKLERPQIALDKHNFTLRHKQNGRQFADNLPFSNVFHWNMIFFINVSLKFAPIDNSSASIQAMTWHPKNRFKKTELTRNIFKWQIF